MNTRSKSSSPFSRRSDHQRARNSKRGAERRGFSRTFRSRKAGRREQPPPGATPQKVVISLQVGGFFFALANVICVAILAWTYLSVKLEPKTIEVKGSAKKAIESDLITWSGTITARDPDLTKAYDKLKADADHVAAFLKEKGVPETEITFSATKEEAGHLPGFLYHPFASLLQRCEYLSGRDDVSVDTKLLRGRPRARPMS